MRIVHVTHRAWPMVGGSERYVQEIARRQVLDGHRVTVVTTDADDLSALWDRRSRRTGPDVPREHQGVRIRRLPVRHLPLGGLTFPALRRVVWLLSHVSGRASLAFSRFSPWVQGLPRALAEESADLLFAWNITLEGLTAAVAREAERRRVPWVAVPILHLGMIRFYAMRHQLDLLRRAQAVLTQTTSEWAFLSERGLGFDKLHVVSPGVNPTEGDQADGQRFRQRYGIDGPVVLSLGPLCYDKGVPHLLAAAQRLWDEGRRLTVALLGPQQESGRRAVARLPERYQPSCLCLGQVSEEVKWDALDAADLLALPSRTEAFGIVFLEAWSRGKPVIGARVGAVPDVIEDGVDGLLVEFGDVDGLAGTLSMLLDDPRLCAELGRRGREKVRRKYTWDRQYARLCTVLEHLLAE
jgi:glycogen(starch) synthase